MTARTARAAAFALVLLVSLAPTLRAGAADEQPKLISMVEKRFDDFFLFVTDDGEHYDLLQQIQTREGLPDKPDLTCFMKKCFLTIGSATTKQLADTQSLDILSMFRDVQTNYRELRRAGATERAEAAAKWRGSAARLACALRESRAC